MAAVGGNANAEGQAGLFYLNSNNSSGNRNSNYGGRLCLLNQNREIWNNATSVFFTLFRETPHLSVKKQESPISISNFYMNSWKSESSGSK